MYLSLFKHLFVKDDFSDFNLYFPEAAITGTLFCYYNDIVALGQMWFFEPKKFSCKPFYPVPLYRIAHLSAGGDSKSCNAQPIFLENQEKVF